MLHFLFIQQIYIPDILKMLHTLFFSTSKCLLFHNATLFGSCIIHILYTGCAKIKKENSGAKGLILLFHLLLCLPSGHFLSGFPTKSLYAVLSCTSHPLWHSHINSTTKHACSLCRKPFKMQIKYCFFGLFISFATYLLVGYNFLFLMFFRPCIIV